MTSSKPGKHSVSKGSLPKSRRTQDHTPRHSHRHNSADMMPSTIAVMDAPPMTHFTLSSGYNARRSRQCEVASCVESNSHPPDDDFHYLAEGQGFPEQDDVLAYRTMMMQLEYSGLDPYETLALATSSRHAAVNCSAFGPGSQLENMHPYAGTLQSNVAPMDFGQYPYEFQDFEQSYCNSASIQEELYNSYGVLSPSLSNNFCDEPVVGIDYQVSGLVSGMSSQPGRHDAPNQVNQDLTVCEPLGPSALQQYSGPTRASAHPRPLRSASEKKDQYSSSSYHQGSRTAVQEKIGTPKPRDDPRYGAKMGKDGYWRCPFANCQHKPTKQKCIYAKYLDSHLRPYRCKVKKPECQEKTFSSNACLFRHEREAHGLHGHGENPHLCIFHGCDRNKPGNGFPRKWNLGDHMKRVHNYDMTEDDCSPPDSGDHYSPPEPPRKRKGSDGSTSVQMKRSSSSQAKALAASAAYSRETTYNSSTAQHTPQVAYANYNRMGPCNPHSPYSLPVDNVQYSQLAAAYPHQSRHAPVYAKIPYRVARAY